MLDLKVATGWSDLGACRNAEAPTPKLPIVSIATKKNLIVPAA
jgi:hypothetical protein